MHVKKFSGYDDILSYSRPIMSSISMHGNIFPSACIGKPFIEPPTREREREEERDKANGTHPRLWLSVLSEASSVTESCVRGPWVTSTPMLPRSNVA